MIVIIIIIVIIAIFTYMLILGANKCKTDEERRLEDEEQIKYIRKWEENRDVK